MSDDILTLKFGSVKSWNLSSDNVAHEKILSLSDLPFRYLNGVRYLSEEQKNVVCEVIDLVDGQIILEWTGKSMSKEEAKAYVLNYGKGD